jgi:hypothetical protein
MSRPLRLSGWSPWAGLFAGAAAWFAHQSFGADANYWDCRFGGPVWTTALGVVCAAIAAGGGWISWSARSSGGETAGETRRFSGLVGAATAAIFLMTITFQTLGGLIVPACAR